MYNYLALDDFEVFAKRLGNVLPTAQLGALSEIILRRSACLAFLSATGPDAKGEADLARLMLRALPDEDKGEECLPEDKFDVEEVFRFEEGERLDV